MLSRTRKFGVLALSAVLVGALVGVTPAAADPPRPKKDLGYSDKVLLQKARSKGQKTVTLLVAADKGQSNEVAKQVAKLGGTVEKRTDSIGYLRVKINIDKAEDVANVLGVKAADVDDVIPLEDPRPEGTVDPIPQSPPRATTPRVNPYMPTADIGSAQFVNQNPTWDGRGVTVGILDTGVDLGHPALNTTSTGERKIVDWVTYTDPTFVGNTNADNDPTWIQMNTTVDGSTVGLPGEGSIQTGTFNERDPRLGGELGNDVNRDGNPAGSSGTFGVAWNKATSRVWVDTNQNGTFADDQPMTDYKVNYDVGHFGTDNPATPISESMPFVVQTDPADNVVNIGIVSGAHGSHVAGIVAGNKLLGGSMSGAAPGAKLVSVRVCLFIAGCTNHALLEGMIYAVTQAHVNAINMSIGGLPALNDGNNARAQLYNSLIDTYGVQMFFSAGNSGPGMNTIGDPAVATNVVSVGSYITSATWLANYGSRTGPAENLHPFSSRGPAEDGALKPEIVAPGSAISAVPTWQPGQPVVGTYTLPPGYGMFQGTSMASPQMAGAGALLLSAAKANGLTVTPAQLRKSLFSSARFLTDYSAYEQGNGLANVGVAWNLLKKLPRTDTITAKVPVSTALSGFLATPGAGIGINDREGVVLGTQYTRTYTLRRTSGPAGTVKYKLSWLSGDGTFVTAGNVMLPLNTDVSLPVLVKAKSVGAHSALLQFDDTSSPGIEFETLNTIVVPNELSTATPSKTVSGKIGRNQTTSYFFRVPTGVTALKVDLTGPDATAGTGQARFLRFSPYGLPSEDAETNSLYCYSPPVSGGTCSNPLSRTVSNPLPGVWEITVEARRTSDLLNTPYTLTASLLGVSVSPNPDVIASGTLGQPINRSYTMTNLQGAFTGRAVGTALGSAKLATPTIADGAQQQFQVNVTPGTTSLKAAIGGASDLNADLDLFAYNCSTGSCVLTAQSAGSTAVESLTVNNPAVGIWVILVDGYAVPSGSTTYNYRDVLANPSYGAIAVSDANALRAPGAQWTAPATVTPTGVPAAGRVLYGNVEVRTDANVLIGSGDVIVQSVS
ncbi:S8 family serine peptidase [Kribbella pratensis]|uniref:Subtilisin family serine protease n=1 Tax=Kribbella pratensis TaxID=2512112 RepID=A0A4R8CH98_9ACTN|nr:S8 family serine peptidase [Kribbella pratensis]TDW75494.1 subtilisin family serine protease [Kribbella pratensis]